jgi:hypothetical protein
MGVRISQLPKKENLESLDIFPVVDRLGNNYKLEASEIFEAADIEGSSDVYIKNILKSVGANETSVTFDSLIQDQIFCRVDVENFPKKRGWIKSVSNVSINGQQVLENQDFVFSSDRQCFYFKSNMGVRNNGKRGW